MSAVGVLGCAGHQIEARRLGVLERDLRCKVCIPCGNGVDKSVVLCPHGVEPLPSVADRAAVGVDQAGPALQHFERQRVRGWTVCPIVREQQLAQTKKRPDRGFTIRALNGRLLVSPLVCLDRFSAP